MRLRLHHHAGCRHTRHLVDGRDHRFDGQVSPVVAVKSGVEPGSDNARRGNVLPTSTSVGWGVAYGHEIGRGNAVCLAWGSYVPSVTSEAYLIIRTFAVADDLWWRTAEGLEISGGDLVMARGAVCASRGAFSGSDGGGGPLLEPGERDVGVEYRNRGGKVGAIGGVDGDLDGEE